MSIGTNFIFGKEGPEMLSDKEFKEKYGLTKRQKGKSLIQFPENYVVLDIETTGLCPSFDEIIELSAIKVRDNVVVDKFTSLVQPEEQECCSDEDEDKDKDKDKEDYIFEKYFVDSFITSLTGITNKMLETAPKIKDILPNFVDFIGDDILVGHNINFDINFIYDDLKGYFNKEFKNDFVDTLRISKKLLPHLKNHKLKTLAKFYNIEQNTAHRGLEDCKATYALYNNLRISIINEYNTAENFYKSNWYHFSSGEIETEKQIFDESHIFYKKSCVFTGTLKMLRKEAMQIIVDLGGNISDSLNKEVNFLIVGQQDYTKTKESGKSSKMLKAEKYILKGQDLTVIPENVFYDLINQTDE